VVHRLRRLQVDEQHRRTAPLRDRDEHRRGHVGREKTDDEVTAGDAQLLRRPRTLFRIGDEADVDDVAVQLRHALRHSRGRLLQLGEQVGKLRPVGAEAAGDEADSRSASGDPLKTRGVIDVALSCRHRSLLTRQLDITTGRRSA